MTQEQQQQLWPSGPKAVLALVRPLQSSGQKIVTGCCDMPQGRHGMPVGLHQYPVMLHTG